MKYIPLTQGKQAIVDDKDYEELSKYKWCFDSRYACRCVWIKRDKKYKMIRMHQFIYTVPKGFEVDHINKNKLDNRRSNLRRATHASNIWNRDMLKTNTSGYVGAYYNKHDDLWYSMIRRNGKRIYLGVFNSAQEAGEAYKKEAQRLTNLP